MSAILFKQLAQSLREAGKIRRGETKPSRRFTAPGRLRYGDWVTHSHRGPGIFECYAADESCFVRFDGTGESEKVTSSMVKKVQPQKQ